MHINLGEETQLKPIIETERLLLREILPEDKEDMLRMHSDEEVHRYTGEPTIQSLEDLVN